MQKFNESEALVCFEAALSHIKDDWMANQVDPLYQLSVTDGAICLDSVVPHRESLPQPTIVSGLTALGIPLLAYKYAESRGWKTMGIACSKAGDYECYACDRIHIVGDNWGDETSAFLASIDVLIRIGGGKQSLEECRKAQVMGIPVYQEDLSAL